MATKTATTTDATTAPPAAPRSRRAATKPATGATTRPRRSKAAPTAPADPAEVLAGLAAAVTAAERVLADARAQRDGMIADVIASKVLSGPAVGKIVGLTPMATYNAARRAK